MELGNLLFGNSRGEAQVPRNCGWEEPLLDLFHVCSIDEAGYPGCENAVFTIRGYDWDAECTCGFNDRAEAWHVAHPHADECYDSVMNRIMADYDALTGYGAAFPNGYGLLAAFDAATESMLPGITTTIFTPRADSAMANYRVDRDRRDDFRERARKKLCAERGLTYPYGCAVHCDCYKERAAEAWFKVNDHNSSCRLVQPNFLFKPTGFRVNWYKYPLRDSYMTPQVTLAEWHSIIEICRAAVS